MMVQTSRACDGRGATILALAVLFLGTGSTKAAESGTPVREAVSRGDPEGTASIALAVNADSNTNDSKPSLAVLADGTTWMAWHAYSPGHDHICARRLGPDGLGPIVELSQQGHIHDAPRLVATGGSEAWVFWSAMLQGRWQLIGRRFSASQSQPAAILSGPATDALMPTAAHLGNGGVLLAWSDRQDGRFRIRSRALRDGVWGEPTEISSGEYDAHRPIVVSGGDQAWIAWDEYRQGNYAVFARQLLPQRGPTEQVSPPGQNSLLPAARLTARGPAVAWVRSSDVSNHAGAICQIHTLHMALRNGQTWQIIRDGQGDPTAATLVHGLTARMEPHPAAKLGHMAPLRKPMLLGDGPTLWLLWERKMHDPQHPAHSLADLAARPCRDGQWGPTVIVQSNLLDYHLSTEPRAQNGRFPLLASELPRGQRRIYRLLHCDLGETQPFHQDPWTGYQAVTLPLPGEEQPPGHEIRAGGKTYRLYWVDLHNHSGLTCDAHGEPDELFHYARDRARIHAMALTDNDEVFDDPLTEAEYALGAFFARHVSEDGRFVGLPGYEWTSHVPNANVTVDRSDPRCWDFRWHARHCHNNHRTVIYPPSGGPILRHSEIGNNIERMFETVAGQGGVVFPHHPSWDVTGHRVEVGAEVVSAWTNAGMNARLIHRVLNEGHRMGFAGNSDSHRRNPGLAGALTAVYAEALTGEAILEALRSRRFYATNGSWIVLDSWAKGSLIGQHVEAPDGIVEITLVAIGTRPIVSATLMGDGKELQTFDGTGQREFHTRYRTQRLEPGRHWFYWRIVQEGSSPQFPGNVSVARGHLAWCSPHWVTVPGTPRP